MKFTYKLMTILSLLTLTTQSWAASAEKPAGEAENKAVAAAPAKLVAQAAIQGAFKELMAQSKERDLKGVTAATCETLHKTILPAFKVNVSDTTDSMSTNLSQASLYAHTHGLRAIKRNILVAKAYPQKPEDWNTLAHLAQHFGNGDPMALVAEKEGGRTLSSFLFIYQAAGATSTFPVTVYGLTYAAFENIDDYQEQATQILGLIQEAIEQNKAAAVKA